MVKPNLMLDLLRRRIVFYSDSSKQSNVFMQKFQILEHPDLKGSYFIHLKYQYQELEKPKEFLDVEEIETFAVDTGWVCMVNQDKPTDLAYFLKNTTVCKHINISSVQLK